MRQRISEGALKRRNDGSLPEKQDRAGYSKYWQYIVHYREKNSQWEHIQGRYERLDKAIDAAEATVDLGYDVDIFQETTTKVWTDSVDYPEV